MKRLTMTDAEMEEIRQYNPDFDCPIKAEEDSQILNFCNYVCDEFQHNCPFKNMGNRLKAYEDAEEQGLIFRLPVTEGSTVFVINYKYECKYDYDCQEPFDHYKCEEDIRCEHEYKVYYVREAVFNHMMMDKLGKTVFLTKEEAEKALKDMQGV